MRPREFALERLANENILTRWASSVAGRVPGLGMLEIRELAGLWEDHPDYREEWRP